MFYDEEDNAFNDFTSQNLVPAQQIKHYLVCGSLVVVAT